MKKKEVVSSNATIAEDLVSWNPKKVFTEKDGKVFIGGEEIKPEIRSILKDQAIYLETSHLWEILTNTIKQEAINMSLLDSTEWDHVLSAKMLWHWNHVLEVMIRTLRK